MYGLMDCNNFFVSCERVFNPALNGRPVVVLSGNDGCVIARSNEAKKIGIPMGVPAFQVREMIEKNNIVIFSGNHELYHDMSRRIMSILAQEVEDIDVYSVDEAFFSIHDTRIKDIEDFITPLAQKIYQSVGVPVSIGAGKTRTLSKIATHIAKKEYAEKRNTYVLHDEKDIINRLKNIDIDDIWGIGRRMSKVLYEYNIHTAYDFTRLPQHWIKSRFSITGERTWLELHGIDCAISHSVDEIRQSVTVSLTFGHTITDYRSLSEAVATFATRCAVKLREQKLIAGYITIYIRGNKYDSDMLQYSNSAHMRIPFPTSSSIEIVKYSNILLGTIFRSGFGYKKAGVLLTELSDESRVQLNLFHSVDEGKHKRLMQAVDKINLNSGRSKVRLLSEGTDYNWHPKELHKSKAFSTKLKDIIVVNCKK